MLPLLAKLTRSHGRLQTPSVDGDRVVQLLCRPAGATIDELADALDLAPRAVRAYLDGPLRKTLGHKVPSQTLFGLIRVYRLPTRRRA